MLRVLASAAILAAMGSPALAGDVKGEWARDDGKVTVTVGSQTQIFDPPGGKDIDVQMVVDLRHLLSQAGYDPHGG